MEDLTQNEGVECDVCERHFAKKSHLKTHKRFGTKCISPYQHQTTTERSDCSSSSVGSAINVPRRNTRSNSFGELISLSRQITRRHSYVRSNNQLPNNPALQQQQEETRVSSSRNEYHTLEDQFPEDFSIIDDRDYSDLPAPDRDLFFTGENEPPREDGRSQRLIDYCTALMENRNRGPPQPNMMEKIFFASIQFLALFLYVGAKYAFIYCLGLAFFYCSTEQQCGSLVNYYVVDIAK